MLQLNAAYQSTDSEAKPKRWPYKKHSFPNGKESYWIKWKLYPDDIKFRCFTKTLVIDFDKELNLNNPNISALNEWKVTKLSYSSNLPKLCEELNFFEAMYDTDGELIAALFKIKCLIDKDLTSYTAVNFNAFRDLVYQTIFTESMKDKIIRCVEENYTDDIEAENSRTLKDPEMLSILQKKKKSLEFLNVHVKAMLKIAFCIKIVSFICNHFMVMRGIDLKKDITKFYDFYIGTFDLFDFDFKVYNKIYAYVANKTTSAKNFNSIIFGQQEVDGKDLTIVINNIIKRNIIIDNFIKFQLPATWDAAKNKPRERIMSFMCSIVNMHISIFVLSAFRRNLIELDMTPDVDGNVKNDRYRTSKMKLNEEYVILSSLDIHRNIEKIYKDYEKDITAEEINYYRKNLNVGKLQQQLIEIYFFPYMESSQEFALLRNIDMYKLLLIMRKDIMRRYNVTKDTILDSLLTLILTANIEESPIGDKMYVKDTKYLSEHPDYKLLVEKFYSNIIDINEDAIKKFLITFVNAKYKFVLYEEPGLLNEEIQINKRELIDELLTFLIMANRNISTENMGVCNR